MALIRCPECGNSISDKAEKCPHCGLPAKFFPIQQEKAQEEVDYKNLANILVSFDGDYARLFSSSHYITHRDTEYLTETYGDYYSNLKNKMIFQYIENHAGQFRVDIDMLKSFLRKMHALDTNITAHNNAYVDSVVAREKDYFDRILFEIDPEIKLDEEQRRAVVTDDDYCLLVAGAGAGKTTTMAAKVKYLVEKQHVNPEEIIVISYTRKAIGELKERINDSLHIPAEIGSELSIFHNVYADIGDEQSIEQNLSTFSSHMTNIIRILRSVEQSPNTALCLFDELCAGTDPAEGAALATSILATLHTEGVKTMATTHYSELKEYALSTDGVENAACEFSLETLSPTYRLLIGVPGKSNAFAISRKLGLPEGIIDDARNRMTDHAQSFEDLLSDLTDQKTSLEKSRDDAKRLEETLARREAALHEAEAKLQDENTQLKAAVEQMQREKAAGVARDIAARLASSPVIVERMADDVNTLKDAVLALRNDHPDMAVVLGSVKEGKPALLIVLGENRVAAGLNAGQMVRTLGKEIQGGGGGQPHFATAGGRNADGLDKALALANELIAH